MLYGYSSVAAFAVTEISGDCVYGYAAPNGERPTLVKLTSDGAPVAFSRATGYSPTAAAAGIRMGWCAFQIHGLRSAFAIGDEVKLSCGVSGEVLTSLSIDMLGAPKTEDLRLSALDLVALLRQSDACPGLEQLLPFALNHYRRHGARQFIEASYLTLLGRWPDPTAPDVDFSLESDAERITVYIEDLIGSQEYKEKWGGIIPGPFVSGFRFDTTELI